jgi:uncharacterized beta barrel domain-containing protein DUF5777
MIKHLYKLTLLLLIGLAVNNPMKAQKDTTKKVQEDWRSLISLDSLNTDGYTNATFKTTRIINGQSLETVKAHTLDFRVTHRFGSVETGIHQLYGFDNADDIRIAFEYGITDRLTVGFSRSKIDENLEGLIKYRLIRQTANGKMPLSITLFANTALTPKQDLTVTPEYPGDLSVFAHRLSYTYQAIIGRKFSSGFSLQFMPTLVHRNFVSDPDDANDVYSMGVGGRLKITKRTAIVIDYFYNVNPTNNSRSDATTGITYYNPLGIGWEIETGGHVFTIMFSNSAGIIENEFIPYTTESWLKKGFKFSFDISRDFTL